MFSLGAPGREKRHTHFVFITCPIFKDSHLAWHRFRAAQLTPRREVLRALVDAESCGWGFSVSSEQGI
jgi:hypothetical protein